MDNIETRKISVNTILDFLQSEVEEKHQLDSNLWIDAAHKLVILLGDEHERLFDLQQKVAKIKLGYLEGQDKRNVSEAKLKTEATDEYREYKIQEAKVKRIEEFVRVAKKRADISRGL